MPAYLNPCTFPSPHRYPCLAGRQAFGMMMSDRQWSSESGYRFGFNGQELENEVYNSGQTYSAEFWQYDSRLGRRCNLDPILVSDMSGYSCLNNAPIMYRDELGLNPDDYYNEKGEKIYTDNRNSDNIWIIDQKSLVIIDNFISMMGLEKGSTAYAAVFEYALYANSKSVDQAVEDGYSLEALANIFTSILHDMEEFNSKDILNGEVTVLRAKYNPSEEVYDYTGYNYQYYSNGDNRTLGWVVYAYGAYSSTMPDGTIAIVAQMETSMKLLNTVSDVQSLLGIHEYYLHQKLGLSKEDHPLIYKLIQQHETWKKVSDEMKNNYNKSSYHE